MRKGLVLGIHLQGCWTWQAGTAPAQKRIQTTETQNRQENRLQSLCQSSRQSCLALVDQEPPAPGKGKVMGKNGSTQKPESLRKAEFLVYWEGLQMEMPVKPSPVPYKHKGSTYAEDGIRITGSRRFVDQVISNLKSLLTFENDMTRLQVVYKQSTNRETGRPINAWNCYIQVHERGGEAQMVNAFMSAVTGRQSSV